MSNATIFSEMKLVLTVRIYLPTYYVINGSKFEKECKKLCQCSIHTCTILPRMQPTLPAVPSSKPAKQVNYRTAPNKTFVHARFLLECGNKLNAKVMTVATALSTFHKFCRAASTNITEYDPYVRQNNVLHYSYYLIACPLLAPKFIVDV